MQRHEFSKTGAENYFTSNNKTIDLCLKIFSSNQFHVLSDLSRLALQNLGNAVGISLSEDEQLKYLDYFIESGLAACQMAVNVGKEIKIVLNEEIHRIIQGHDKERG